MDLIFLGATPSGPAARAMREMVVGFDPLGSHPHRGEGLEGPQPRLKDSLTVRQMPGSSAGAAHSFVDERVVAGLTYWCSLDVDVCGIAMAHGPVAVRVPPSRKVLVRSRCALPSDGGDLSPAICQASGERPMDGADMVPLSY